jgi:alpha-glucosidase
MSANNYPEWQLTVQMPANSTFSYEYVRKESDGSWIYESSNRTITTGDCNTGLQSVSDTITTSSGAQKRGISPVPLVRSPVAASLHRRDGSMLGLPDRDLINPKYSINDTAGSISNLTVQTDLIHENGLAEYDTHNMYGTMMSATSRNAMLNRRPTVRPLVYVLPSMFKLNLH